MKIKNLIFIVFFSILLSCCQYFKAKPVSSLARIQDDYFYFDDIKDVFSKNLSKEDSIIYVKNQIFKWAKNHILYDKALINLDKDEQSKLLELVQSYENDLFSHYYKEKMVKALMDTLILDDEIKKYHNLNKSNFKLNQDLIKGRYLKIKADNYNIKDVVKRFRRFNIDDMEFLDSISLQFASYYFNDSVWINKNVFFNKLPEINLNIKNRILKKSLFHLIEDSLELYLIKINESIFRNDLAPIEFIRPTLKQILLNKKKLEFISKFEKDLIEDAIQKKEFEFYETNK
ncbi:MAG: peptidyl-prolyl cis-trans isomerase [Bacteroidetes bacterium]|nr:peptidyl-prolyl cis-trans isomerase [Bacteroidota bacterium]